MILKDPQRLAVFAAAKMGKVDLFRGDHLFAGLNSFEPGQSHAPHTHCDRDKIYLILAGRGELTVGAETVAVEPPDTALARAGVEHSLTNTGTERLVALVVMGPPPPQRPGERGDPP